MNLPKLRRLLLVPIGTTTLFVLTALATTIFGWRPINPGADLLLALAVGLALVISLMLLLPED